jgi:feruloyl-CoA synthase
MNGMAAAPLHSTLTFAPASIQLERRADGSMVVRSAQALQPCARTVGEWLLRWAAEAPDRTFLAERRGDDWWRLSYREALGLVRRAGQGLLDNGLGPDRPLMILSDNSIEHAVLALGAMFVGVPVAPVSPAYALLSQDHAKLLQIAQLLQPGAVFTGGGERYGKALKALGVEASTFESLTSREAAAGVDEAHRALTPDSVAKILFTSGSTGTSKGVINTQRMLTANQQQSVQVWPFLAEEPPVVVDWLPWNHTFGGNYNLHMVLSNGGTMYIDGGKPVPGLIETTLRNLREVAPTMYFNVPRGFDLLLPHLEQDPELRRRFFSRCAFVFYAGAALPQGLWDRFVALAHEERGGDLALVSSWGSTETAPLCTAVHFNVDRAGIVGLPVPGCELKLVPSDGKLEARVRGPHVTPGYYRREDLAAAAFDEEGFYRIGDALRFCDAAAPEQGLAFDGRVVEDFKLRTGTWVHVGALRMQLITACGPLVQDAVITGHDRDEVGALLFLHPITTTGLSLDELHGRIGQGLSQLAAMNGTGSAGRVARARIVAEAPRLDLGEITDKGYVNQRAVLELRAAEVECLHAAHPDSQVIFPAEVVASASTR